MTTQTSKTADARTMTAEEADADIVASLKGLIEKAVIKLEDEDFQAVLAGLVCRYDELDWDDLIEALIVEEGRRGIGPDIADIAAYINNAIIRGDFFPYADFKTRWPDATKAQLNRAMSIVTRELFREDLPGQGAEHEDIASIRSKYASWRAWIDRGMSP